MEIITNKILEQITVDPFPRKYSQKESQELSAIDKQIEIEAHKILEDAFKNDPGVKYLMENTDSEEEKTLFTMLIGIRYFYYLSDKIKPQLEEQLELCRDFVKSDMCKRNIELKNGTEQEIQKLEQAVKSDLLSWAFKSLDDYYKIMHPRLSQRKRYIKISEKLKFLNIDPKKKYMDEDEADGIILRNNKACADKASDMIYDNIKKEIWKAQKSEYLKEIKGKIH